MNDKPACCAIGEVAGPPKKVAFVRVAGGYMRLGPALSTAIAELLGSDTNLGDAPEFVIREETTADNTPPTIDVARLKQYDDEPYVCPRKRERDRRAQQKAMERLQTRSSRNRKRR